MSAKYYSICDDKYLKKVCRERPKTCAYCAHVVFQNAKRHGKQHPGKVFNELDAWEVPIDAFFKSHDTW